MAVLPGVLGRGERVVWRSAVRRWDEGKGGLEVSSVRLFRVSVARATMAAQYPFLLLVGGP